MKTLNDIAKRTGERLYGFWIILEHDEREYRQAWGKDRNAARRRLYADLRRCKTVFARIEDEKGEQ